MKTSQDLTLVLSMFGRQEFSERFFKYLELTDCPYPIIFADGDVDGYGKNLVKKFSNSLDITHIEHKQTKKFLHYYEMQVKALSAVKTPYAMLCDNDDFIIYSSIKKLIKFLHNNTDYVSAGSPITQIQLDNFSTNCYGKYATLCTPYSHYRGEEPLNSWEEQVHKTFLDFQPSFYNIQKTSNLLTIWKEILELDLSDLTIMEFYYQLRVPTFGKQHADPSITHYVRQSGTGSWEKNYNFSKNLVYNNLPEDIRKVAKKISYICEKEYSSNPQNIYSTILDSYSQHLNNYLPHNVMRYRWPRIYSTKIFIKNILSKLSLILKISFFLKELKVLNYYKKTKKSSYPQFIREIKKIKETLHQS
tara:strand:- start:24 stop:1106 length:1083 start_codon:yes stop_codon:yes gene_type:complete